MRERPSRLELAESPSDRVSVGEVVKGNAVKIRKSDAVGKVRDVDAELPARDILLLDARRPCEFLLSEPSSEAQSFETFGYLFSFVHKHLLHEIA